MITNSNRAIHRFMALLTFLIVTTVLLPGEHLLAEERQREETLLVEGGRPTAEVVLPRFPTETEIRAADEIVSYLLAMTGARLPIRREEENSDPPRDRRLLVGRTQEAAKLGLLESLDSLPEGSYRIRSLPSEQRIFLVGKGDLGILYAAYGLLRDHLGVRWYFPDDLGKVIPRQDTVRIARVDEENQPDFTLRWVGRGDWALFNGCNVRVYSGHDLDVNRAAHTFGILCSPNDYWKEHREFFPLVAGRRTPYGGKSKKNGESKLNQLCTSNPQVVETVAANAIRIFEKDPSIDIVTIFPNDSFGFCECGRCRSLDEKGTPTVDQINAGKGWERMGPERHRAMSRRMTIFYIEVAKRILERFPHKHVMVGAYKPYLYPPEDENLKAPPNVILELCHHPGCQNHALLGNSCMINKRFREALKGWGRIYSHLSIYEYYYKARALGLPWPVVHTVEKDIPYFKSQNVFGLFTQYKNDYYMNGLNYYVAARMLWNSDLDVRNELDQFYRSFYGSSWHSMKQYWDSYENRLAGSEVHLTFSFSEFLDLYTREFLDHQRKCIADALGTEKDETVRKRIHKCEIVLKYLELVRGYLDAIRMYNSSRRLFKKAQFSYGALERLAGEIKSFRELNRESGCFPEKEGGEFRSFLDPNYVIRHWNTYGVWPEKKNVSSSSTKESVALKR